MVDFEQLAIRLGQVEHFRTLKPTELRSIVDSGRIQHFSAGEIIFIEEEPSAGLFVLLSGRVQLCALSPQGQISILAIFEPVIMFNEVSALDGAPNPATVISLEESIVWNMSAVDLEKLVIHYPLIGLGIARVLAQRNRRLVRQFQDLSFRTVLARSARILIDLSQNGQIKIDRRRHPNHQLAAQIATVPEAFSRSLRIFRSNGDVSTTDQSIEVLRPAQLIEIAQVGPFHS
jgi:CRP-like cAMP-binding protein